MTKTQKLRPPVKTHGGKFTMVCNIVPLLPPHRVYCETFLGGGSILLNKPKSEVEVASDIDPDVVNMWDVIQDNSGEFPLYLATVNYTEAMFKWAGQTVHEPFDRAARFVVRRRFSRGGMGKTFAWSDRLRGGQPGDANAWDTIRAELPAIADRVRDVRFRVADGFTMPPEADDVDALIYCDPPYLLATRTALDVYAHEVTPKRSGQSKADRLALDIQRHEALLDALLASRAKVAISGYWSPLYADKLAGWKCYSFDLPNASGQGKTKERREECLWIRA